MSLSGAFIKINGNSYPWPDKESGVQTTSTAVNAGTDANNEFIGEKVGRDRSKIELVWTQMDAQTWSRLLQEFENNFVSSISYYDMVKGQIIIRSCYVGDRSATPGEVDNDGVWITARQCKLNLVDCGYRA